MLPKSRTKEQVGVIQYFLAIFVNEHYAADQVDFYERNSNKSANLAAQCMPGKVFTFKKSQRP